MYGRCTFGSPHAQLMSTSPTYVSGALAEISGGVRRVIEAADEAAEALRKELAELQESEGPEDQDDGRRARRRARRAAAKARGRIEADLQRIVALRQQAAALQVAVDRAEAEHSEEPAEDEVSGGEEAEASEVAEAPEEAQAAGSAELSNADIAAAINGNGAAKRNGAGGNGGAEEKGAAEVAHGAELESAVGAEAGVMAVGGGAEEGERSVRFAPGAPPPAARVLALQLHIKGRDREAIARWLAREFSIDDPAGLLDELGIH